MGTLGAQPDDLAVQLQAMHLGLPKSTFRCPPQADRAGRSPGRPAPVSCNRWLGRRQRRGRAHETSMHRVCTASRARTAVLEPGASRQTGLMLALYLAALGIGAYLAWGL